MRFQVQPPRESKLFAWYGFDPVMGFFVTLEEYDEPKDSYDAITKGYNFERPLLGALLFMAEKGFFGRFDIDAAVVALERGSKTRGSVGRAAEVITNFKAAAAE